MTFNGFISYSHAADGRLAPAVQRGLHRLAKPWHRRRALWIFRDQTGLSVTPALWSSIQDALDGSDYFVLLASPEAAGSPWVNREIEHWVATKPADRILPVVTDGEWNWDRDLKDFAADSTAVPAALRGVFAEEPLFLDLRWARGGEQLSLQHSRFRDAIAQLAAPMHGVSKDDLEGEDVRQHRRARRMRSGAVAALVVLALVASLTGVLAVRYAERANSSAAEARRQQKSAAEQRTSADHFEQDAHDQELAAQQQKGVAATATAEASKQTDLAQHQQDLADQATAEADRQQANARRQQALADQAATRTREQQRLAEESKKRAAAAKKEAERQQAIAKEQQRKADAAKAEATRQQKKADQQERVAVSRRLVNQARATIGYDPATALKLGVAAQAVLPDAATRSQFAGLVAGTQYAGTLDDVTVVASAPDGVLASVNTNGSVSLWNVTDRTHPAKIVTLADPGPIDGTVAFSHDGKTLAVLNPLHRPVLWNVADRRHPVRIATLPTSTGVGSVAFSQDGGMFATGGWLGRTTLWSIADPAHPTVLSVLDNDRNYPVDHVGFSNDGTLLMANRTITNPLWDITDRRNPKLVRSVDDVNVGSLAFNPTSFGLITGDYHGTVHEWYLPEILDGDFLQFAPTTVPPPPQKPEPTGTGPASPPAPDDPDPLNSPPHIPHPDGSAPPNLPEDQAISPVPGFTGSIGALTYSADGTLAAAGDSDGHVAVWDTRKAISTALTLTAHGPITSIAISSDDATLVTTDNSGAATMWNVASRTVPSLTAKLTGPYNLAGLTFGAGGRSLMTANFDGTAIGWDVTRPAHPVAGPSVRINPAQSPYVAFSPDLRTAAAAGRDARVTLTDLTDPARPVPLAVIDPKAAGPGSLAFSPDGRALAVISDHTLALWDLTVRNRPALLATLGTDLSGGTEVTFSPDGRTVAAGTGLHAVSLWDVSNRAKPVRLATANGHSDVVTAVAFSPDGRTLATGSSDRSAAIWDIADRTRPLRFAAITGQPTQIWSLAFSPDGRTLATAVSYNTNVLWDLTDRTAPIRLAAFQNPGTTASKLIRFSPDGRTLAEGDSYSSLWDYTTLNNLRADPAKVACTITGDGLTAADWKRYVPELKYVRTC